jgi:hypothetical protein
VGVGVGVTTLRIVAALLLGRKPAPDGWYSATIVTGTGFDSDIVEAHWLLSPPRADNVQFATGGDCPFTTQSMLP